jgi:hypothetical protein
MKKIETLQELWAYCLYCPLCKKSCRKINLSVGPDNIFTLVSFKKQDNLLELNCTYMQRKKDKYEANYIINTVSGKFEIELTDIEMPLSAEMNVDSNLDKEEKYRLLQKVKKSYFYFYINSSCKECVVSYISSSVINLNHNTNSIDDIRIEREGLYIIHTKDKYHITILYDDNKTLINKVHIDKKTFALIDEEKIFECPVVNFDFSDFKKLINKIKTIMIFS